MRVTRWLIVAVVLVALVACDDDTASDATTTTEPRSGDAATWIADPARPAKPDDTTIAALVTRLGCNGGTTGTVHPPAVVATDTEVIVTFTVEPSPGKHHCLGNDQVPFEIELDDPLGDRALVDGSCLPPDGEALITEACIQDDTNG